MTPTVIKGAYLALWVALAAGVMYAVMAAGYSFWLAAGLAYVLFFLVNGSLAYRYRARQLKQQGVRPPPFLKYLFFPQPVSFTSPVAVPRPVRVLLGAVILVGGALFVAAGGLILAKLDFSSLAHPVGAVFMLLALAVLGLAIGYVGLRLIVVQNDEPLFSRGGRRSAQP
jgi:hypothetical protein